MEPAGLSLDAGIRGDREGTGEEDVRYVVDLAVQHGTDDVLRARWRTDSIVWVTRDQDSKLDAPAPWVVVWIDCHNPRLAFCRQSSSGSMRAFATTGGIYQYWEAEQYT